MSISERKTNLLIGALLALSLVIGFLNVPLSYADEKTQGDTKEVTTTPTETPSSLESYEFPNLEYQGKKDLKEYWEAVQSCRSEISEVKAAFEGQEVPEDLWSKASDLVDAAQTETDLAKLQATKEELTTLFDEWIQETLAAAGIASSQSYSSQGSTVSYYNEIIQSGVLTRSGGVNSFGGRTETWYSQRVLPGGGLNIPGRHVADDGTIRDADGYIVVAASDLAYGSTVETSLGAGKVYDNGCAPGVTDVYTNW